MLRTFLTDHYSLLIPQRCGWIQARGAERGEPGGQKRDDEEEHRHCNERRRVRGFDLDQHARKYAREGEGCEQADRDADCAEVNSLSYHQTEDA